MKTKIKVCRKMTPAEIKELDAVLAKTKGRVLFPEKVEEGKRILQLMKDSKRKSSF